MEFNDILSVLKYELYILKFCYYSDIMFVLISNFACILCQLISYIFNFL